MFTLKCNNLKDKLYILSRFLYFGDVLAASKKTKLKQLELTKAFSRSHRKVS